MRTWWRSCGRTCCSRRGRGDTGARPPQSPPASRRATRHVCCAACCSTTTSTSRGASPLRTHGKAAAATAKRSALGVSCYASDKLKRFCVLRNFVSNLSFLTTWIRTFVLDRISFFCCPHLSVPLLPGVSYPSWHFTPRNRPAVPCPPAPAQCDAHTVLTWSVCARAKMRRADGGAWRLVGQLHPSSIYHSLSLSSATLLQFLSIN